jgi:hypothetical protein
MSSTSVFVIVHVRCCPADIGEDPQSLLKETSNNGGGG